MQGSSLGLEEARLPTVLIVDDDPMVRRAARRTLERCGRFGKIWEAEDAAEGVFQARRCAPDIVLLDHLLPALDGASARPFFHQSVPEAKIVAFSGALISRPVWADDYVNKADIDRLPDRLLGLVEQIP